MSSLSGVGSTSASDITQWLKQLAQKKTDDTQSSSTGTSGSTSERSAVNAQFLQAALAAGLDTNSVNGLQDEIDSAISSATQSAGSGTDRRQTIMDAVDGVLQKHGVDLDKFKSAMQPPSGAGGAGGPPPGGAGGPRGAGGPSGSGGFQTALLDAAVSAGLSTDDETTVQSDIESAISTATDNATGSSDQRSTIQSAIDSVLKKHGVDLDKFHTALQSELSSADGSFQFVDTQA